VADSGPAFPGWSPALQAALDRLSIAAARPPRGHLAGPVTSRVLGRALEFADYRPYTPGDDPKLVDWRAFSRLDRLYLKQYQEERARTIGVLLDASASLDWGTGEAHKGFFARRLAAALVWIALGRLERVQLYVLRGDNAQRLEPPTSRPGAARLFRTLRDVRESGPLQLDKAVHAALRQLRGDGPIFLVSDLLDANWAEAVHALGARGPGGVILQVLAADEWEPALGDEAELQDSETGELRPTRFGPSELRTYRANLDRLLAEVATACRQFGLRHVALNSSDAIAEVLLKRLTGAGILR